MGPIVQVFTHEMCIMKYQRFQIWIRVNAIKEMCNCVFGSEIDYNLPSVHLIIVRTYLRVTGSQLVDFDPQP